MNGGAHVRGSTDPLRSDGGLPAGRKFLVAVVKAFRRYPGAPACGGMDCWPRSRASHMESVMKRSNVIDLGIASCETKGLVGPGRDDIFLQATEGLADD